MISKFLIISALAIFQASGKPMLNSCFQSNSYNVLNNGFGSSLPQINTHVRTATIENPPVQIPNLTMPTSVSNTCHCMKTIIRPQIRNEIISVPTVDRIVRTVTTPVVETIKYGGNRRIEIQNQPNNIVPLFQGNTVGGFPGNNNNVIVTSGNNGLSNFSGRNINVVTRPVVALSSTSATFPSSTTTILSGSNGFSNGGTITGF